MAIIYSYPLDAVPTTADLLLGSSSASGKPTKSFSIASLVGLVNVQGGTGTVTEISTQNSTFINVQGGPITTAGTITASLSATGDPSNTTFLRGDNKWMPASSIGSPDVQIINDNDILTNAVTSIDFTGAGVTTTLLTGDVTTGTVQVKVDGAVALVDSVVGGNGISAAPITGDVILENTGVIAVTAGTNVTLSSTTGDVTVNASNNPGTVQSVVAGNGLQSTGVLTTNPSISLEYAGSNNYISVAQSDDTITLNDIIAYDQASTGDVKTTRLSTIPIGSLPLVQTYITAGDANTVKNEDSITPPLGFTSTASINNVVTLTSAQYAAPFTPDTNTLYVIVTGATTYDVVLTAVTAPAAWGTLNTDYQITGDTGVPITKSGVVGAAYSFSVTVTPLGSKWFSTPVTGNTITGAFVAVASTNVQMTLSGTLSDVYIPPIRATLLVVVNVQTVGGGLTAIIGGSKTGDFVETTTATSLTIGTTDFVTTATAPVGYTWVGGAPTIVNYAQAGAITINGSQTVVTTVTGTLQLT